MEKTEGLFLNAAAGQWISLGVYVLATIVAIAIAVAHRADLKNITKEKLTAVDAGTADEAPASFSRVTGLVGLAYLVAFCWGLGLFVLSTIWVDPDAVAKVVAGSGNFILTGSALFAPYAFNQLSQVFGRKAETQLRSNDVAEGDAGNIESRLQPAD